MNNQEITLIKEIQNGNIELFSDLYEKYFKKVYTYALLKNNGNTYIAKDITTTTFLKAFENINYISNNKNNFSITTRLYNLAYKSSQDINKFETNDNINNKPDLNNTDYNNYFQNNILTKQILSYIENQGTEMKDIFIHKFRNNFTYDEIANILGKRSSTCKKAYEKLIKKLNEHFKEKEILDKIPNNMPEFLADNDYKEKLNKKIKEKIETTKEQIIDQAILNSIPKKIRRRFYLTGYGYAVCTFLILFLIGFCTNIFTGTIKVPTKYNYIQQDEAFGNINNMGSNKLKDNKEESTLTESGTKINEKLNTNIQQSGTKKGTISKAENFLISRTGENTRDIDIFLDNGFKYNKTYRFTYKDKKFPKLNDKYAVYKPNGVLIGTNKQDQFISNLKIGNISLGKLQNLEIKNFEIQQNIKQGYSIVFDKDSQKLHFYPNNERETRTYTGDLPSNKNIIKNIERNLKILGISLKNYGDGITDNESYDKDIGTINAFYPLLIEGKSVWDPVLSEPIGINVIYDLNNKKIVSIIGIDIASYDVSNYPTIEKKYIESKISQGGTYFNQGALNEDSKIINIDALEVVYIRKVLDNGEIIYVPAIKGTTNSSNDYNVPKYTFNQII